MVNKKILFCEIAGIAYEIEYECDYIKKMFKDYIISDEEIRNKKDINKITYNDSDFQRCSKLYPERMSKHYIEYTCIMDKVGSLLPSQDMLLMHGAAIEYEKKGYIFTAPSGTGKTTHISLWKKYLGDKVTVINGDKPELSFDDSKVYIHGAPWCGKEGWQINTSAPLVGVCLLRRGIKNKIKKINPGEYIEFFMDQFYIGDNNDNVLKVIDLFSKMAERVPFYLLECDISEEAAQCSFEIMAGKNWNEAIGFAEQIPCNTKENMIEL